MTHTLAHLTLTHMMGEWIASQEPIQVATPQEIKNICFPICFKMQKPLIMTNGNVFET